MDELPNFPNYRILFLDNFWLSDFPDIREKTKKCQMLLKKIFDDFKLKLIDILFYP